MYDDPSSDHRDLGMTNGVPFVQTNDSASMRLNLYVVAKAVAAAHTS